MVQNNQQVDLLFHRSVFSVCLALGLLLVSANVIAFESRKKDKMGDHQQILPYDFVFLTTT